MMKWKNILSKFDPNVTFIKIHVLLLIIFGSASFLAYVTGQELIHKAFLLCALWPAFGVLLNVILLYNPFKRKNE